MEACKNAGNVVAIATADYDSADKNSDSSQNNDLILSKPADSSIDWSDHKTMSISFPYHELEDVVTTGISNALQQSPNGIVRTAALSISYNDNDISSFASTIYMKYQDSLGQDYNMPNLSDDELFGFNRINNAQSYQIISLSDLLAGNADSSLIDGHITIIGALQIPDESMYYYQYLKSDYAQQDGADT